MSAAGYKARLRADAHLEILRLLACDPGYSMNHEIVRLVLDSTAAITLTESAVLERLGWLEDRGLVRTEVVGPLTLATLTDRGLAASEGRETVIGVSRPRPSRL